MAEGSGIGDFAKTAGTLSRSPLGIIALFIVLVYGFAALVLGFSNAQFDATPLVWFLILFPVLVLFVFASLVMRHHEKLYTPADLGPSLFVILQAQIRKTQQRVDVIAEITPSIALPPLTPENSRSASAAGVKPVLDHDDPQFGKWGGKREANDRRLTVGPIRPLESDKNYFRIPLRVSATDASGPPLEGKVRFHLHDSFSPDVEEAVARNGEATLTLVAYGAFTVGAELEDGTTLELNLADPDINAPARFKQL